MWSCWHLRQHMSVLFITSLRLRGTSTVPVPIELSVTLKINHVNINLIWITVGTTVWAEVIKMNAYLLINQ